MNDLLSKRFKEETLLFLKILYSMFTNFAFALQYTKNSSHNRTTAFIFFFEQTPAKKASAQLDCWGKAGNRCEIDGFWINRRRSVRREHPSKYDISCICIHITQPDTNTCGLWHVARIFVESRFSWWSWADVFRLFK